jgi:hypothetical protein
MTQALYAHMNKKKKLNAFLLRSESNQGCLLIPLLFNTVLEILAKAIRQEKEIKSIKMRKEKGKLSLFADDMISKDHVEIPNKSTEKQLESLTCPSKVLCYKINI